MLLWAASMTRRMGRPFSALTIVAPRQWLDQTFLGFPCAVPGMTVQEAVEHELRGADPFAPIEFREPSSGSIDGVRFALHIGSSSQDLRAPSVPNVSIDAHGWVASVSLVPSAPQSTAQPLHASACASVFAAALGVAEVYRAAQESAESSSQGQQLPLWVALDSGQATANPSKGVEWLDHGGTRDKVVPWEEDSSGLPSIRNLLLVSAGGLGMNLAHILAESHLSLNLTEIVDPDILGISNLNRLIGVHVADLNSMKALLAVRPFAAHMMVAQASSKSYEQWRVDSDVDRFRSWQDAVAVGVDQTETRLEVASDWPSLLVNGATAGRGWAISAHRPNINGCLGCYYGSARPSYNQRRRVVPCAGAGEALVEPRSDAPPMASYPQVSVSAAAAMAALVIHTAWDAPRNDETTAGRVWDFSTVFPRFARSRTQPRTDSCELLCRKDYLKSFFESHQSQFGGDRER